MENLDKAAQAIDAMSAAPAIMAADDMAKAFEQAGARIANALEAAARSGEFSFDQLAENITQSLAKMAIEELIVAPLQTALDRLGQGGGQAAGPASGLPVSNITLNLPGVSDAQGLSRSAGQIAGALARAVGVGQSYL